MSLTAKTKKWLERNARISLQGKTVVVTGANSGVGYLEKANDARNTLAAEYPQSNVTVMLLDLADFSSIDAFVSKIKEL